MGQKKGYIICLFMLLCIAYSSKQTVSMLLDGFGDSICGDIVGKVDNGSGMLKI